MRIAAVLITTLTTLVALSSFACSDAQATDQSPVKSTKPKTAKKVAINVSEKGYAPAHVDAEAGAPVTLVFTRTTEKGCGTSVVFPGHDIKKDLPLNKPVEITLTPKAKETISFTCGMGMYKGSIVATK